MREIIKSFNKNISEDRRSMLLLPSLFVVLMAALVCGCGDDGVIVTTDESEQCEDILTSESDLTVENEQNEDILTSEYEKNVLENETTVFVYMCGQVCNPGVYELKSGSRIVDGVEAAGGLTDWAAPETVNLSELLADAQKVYIPSVDEVQEYSLSAGIEMAGGNETVGTGDGKININTADETTLTGITGIGTTRAKSIIKYRETYGNFKKPEDIKNVSGIGDASYEKMKDEIKVD